MSEVSQVQMSKEVVIGTMNIALTKAELTIQTLSNIESSLVYNEDNLQSISAFLDKARMAKKIVENEHKAIKEPILRQSQVIDESKRNMLEQIDGVMKNASDRYTILCRDIENRKREAELDRQRKQAILSGIDSNMISFSGKIAECKTDKELIAVESLINLEKSYKKKYAEFFDEAVAKYETLTSLIKIQKESIREFQKLEAQRLEAEKAANDEKIMEIHEQQVLLDAKIDEAKVTVQETAVNQSTTQTVIEPAEILPEVKVRRAMWTWEVDNIKEVAKKMPDWCEIKTIDSKIDEFLKASKAQWEGKEEVIVNGIKFFIKKTY
jgi:hypothetical protein